MNATRRANTLKTALAGALLLGASGAAQASLIGDTVSYSNQFFGGSIGSGTNTVQAGVTEFSQSIAGGLFNIDVEANSVRFFVSGGTPGVDVGFGGGPTNQSFLVTSLDVLGGITGVNVTVSGVNGLLPSPVAFTSNSIELFVGGSQWTYNTDFVLVTFNSGPVVPLPATAALMLAGLLGLGATRRLH